MSETKIWSWASSAGSSQFWLGTLTGIWLGQIFHFYDRHRTLSDKIFEFGVFPLVIALIAIRYLRQRAVWRARRMMGTSHD